MKKIKYLLFAFILILPLCVYAAEQPKVTKLDATITEKTISYNGTMENGSHAVMCKLYDSDNQELKKVSSAVDKNKFEGSFTVKSAGTYKVACANYEGGAIKEIGAIVKEANTTQQQNTEEQATSTETVSEPEKEENNSKNSPKTGDHFITYAIILMVGVIGSIAGFIFFKKSKLSK